MAALLSARNDDDKVNYLFVKYVFGSARLVMMLRYP